MSLILNELFAETVQLPLKNRCRCAVSSGNISAKGLHREKRAGLPPIASLPGDYRRGAPVGAGDDHVELATGVARRIERCSSPIFCCAIAYRADARQPSGDLVPEAWTGDRRLSADQLNTTDISGIGVGQRHCAMASASPLKRPMSG